MRHPLVKSRSHLAQNGRHRRQISALSERAQIASAPPQRPDLLGVGWLARVVPTGDIVLPASHPGTMRNVYSMMRSARFRRSTGTVKPRAPAVLRLITTAGGTPAKVSVKLVP